MKTELDSRERIKLALSAAMIGKNVLDLTDVGNISLALMLLAQAQQRLNELHLWLTSEKHKPVDTPRAIT